MNNYLRHLIAILVGSILAFFVLEIALRVFDPFGLTLRGGHVVLQKNQRRVYVFDAPTTKLDQRISYSTNSIGLRGPEPPQEFDDHLSIVAIGGSTTACWFNGDEKTWPFLLQEQLGSSLKNVWINNAGQGGQTTFGSISMLQEHVLKLRPKVVLLLVGINDMGYRPPNMVATRGTLRGFLVENFEVVNVGVNFWRTYLARARHLSHGKVVDFAAYDVLKLPPELVEKQKALHVELYLEDFRRRVRTLVSLCKEHGIEPILLTQPIAWGEGVDPETSVDLSTIKIDEEMNSGLHWQLLELYNTATRVVAREAGVHLIDLAESVEKNTLYFYDGVHYSNQGTARIAEILVSDLGEYLQSKYPAFAR